MRKGEVEGRLDPNFYLRECFEIKDILTRKYGVHYLKSVIADIYRYPTFYGIEYRQQGVPVIKGENINKDGLISPNQEFDYIDEETHRNFPRTELRENDLVFTVRGLIGKVGIFEGFSTVGNINANVIKIRIKEGFSHKFFWIYLNSNVGQKLISRITSGQVQQTITVPDILKLQIPVPPIEVQKQIIEKFEAAYNAKRAKEAEAKSLLDGIDAYLLERLGIETPAITETKRYFYRTLSEITGSRFDANSYHAERVAAIEAVKNGKYSFSKLKFLTDFSKTIVTDTALPYVGLENIESNTGNFIETSEKQSFGSAVVFNKNQILFPKLRPYLNKVYLAEFDGVSSTEFHILDSKRQDLTNTFLANYLRSKIIVSQTKHLMSGNTLPRLQTEDIENLLIPLPPLEVQEEIAAHIQSIRERARELEREARAEVERAKAEVERMILGEVAADA